MSDVQSHVWLQIYKVDDAKLAVLDQLEGVPHHYIRRQVAVAVVEERNQQYFEKNPIDCWIYIQENFKPELLELPQIADYCKETYREKPYIPRYHCM